jgi:tetratricopeptide (TPR) repeat protein
MPAKVQIMRRLGTVGIGAILVAITACGAGVWATRWYAKSRRDSPAARAYIQGQWSAAAELARRTLAVRKDDRDTLRVLARASARLGLDDAAMAIYQRWFNQTGLETEDLLLVGSIQQRQGRTETATRALKRAIATKEVPPRLLEELAQVCTQGRHWDEAIQAAERLSRQPGWEARGMMIMGTIRYELNNMPAAAESFRSALKTDPAVVDSSHDPTPLRKVIARTFLQASHPDEARPLLLSILDHKHDREASWLLSRVYLRDGNKASAIAALTQAGTYRAENPLETEPGPFVGEARCEKCHAKIYRDSLGNRHTRTYYRGAQLDLLPLPDGPLPDPDDPEVIHKIFRRDGIIRAETRVGGKVFDAVIEYAFGTIDRALTMVSRDASDGYRMARLSYYDTADGKGWDRSTLDETNPTRASPAEFQGQTVGVRDGLAKCLYCHVTNPRTGHDSIGPETNDRAIGCERCHGPGGNHIIALESGFPDLAIVNPASVSPQIVTKKQCNDCHILQKEFRDKEPENPGWVRSQGVGWARSRCNTESGGTFGCVTCHNPHQSARAVSTAAYEVKCLTCHASATSHAAKETSNSTAAAGSSPSARTCPVNASKGCIACHMPRVRIDSLHLELTDHHIRVHPKNLASGAR